MQPLPSPNDFDAISVGGESLLHSAELPQFGRVEFLYSKGSAPHSEDVITARVIDDTLWVLVLDGFSNVRYGTAHEPGAVPLRKVGEKSCGEALVQFLSREFSGFPSTVLSKDSTTEEVLAIINRSSRNFLEANGFHNSLPADRPGAAGMLVRLDERGCMVTHWQDPIFLAWDSNQKMALPNHHFKEETKRAKRFAEIRDELSNTWENEGKEFSLEELRAASWALYGPALTKFRNEYQNNPEIPHSAILDGDPNFPSLTETTHYNAETVAKWRGLIMATDGGVNLSETDSPAHMADALLKRIMGNGAPSLEAALKAKMGPSNGHTAVPEWAAMMILFNHRV